MTFGTLQVSYLDVGNTLDYAVTHSSCARWLQYKEVLNISTVHQPRRLQRHTLPVLCLSKKRLSTVSYQASSSSSICFLLDGRCISRLSTFYFQGGILANFLSFSFPHGCRRYMLCFIFALVKISISFVSKVFLTLSNSRRSKAFHRRQNRFEILQHIKKLKGGGWGSIKGAPPPPTTLGIRVCVYVRTKFVLLVSFTLIKTICSKIWAKLNQCQRMQKVDVRLTCVAQKRLCLSYVMLTEDRRYSEVRGVSIQFFGDLPNIFQSP